MNKIISELNLKFEKLINSKVKSFDEVAALKNVMGVYMIYNDLGELLYIGNTNKFNIRFGTDLKHETTHTFVRKMISNGMFPDRHAVVKYLKSKCSIRIEVCETKREAEALEHLAIYFLDPKLNK